MSEVLIRKMEIRDIGEVISLGLAIPEFHTGTESPQFYSQETLERWIQRPNGVLLVAQVDSDLAGYNLASYNPDNRDGYIHVAVVKEKYRRRGIYGRLLDETMDQLTTLGCNNVWCMVKPDSEAMVEALKKHGFEVGEQFLYIQRSL